MVGERWAFEILENGQRVDYRIPGVLLTAGQPMPGFSGVPEQIVISSSGDEITPTNPLPRGPKLWNFAPSLDTPVCNTIACDFNGIIQKGELPRGLILVTMTMDLPFALDRVKQERELSHVVDGVEYHYLLSDSRSGLFVSSVGGLMLPDRLAERMAIVTIPTKEGRGDTVFHVQEIVDQGIMPDYTPTLRAIRRIPSELFKGA